MEKRRGIDDRGTREEKRKRQRVQIMVVVKFEVDGVDVWCWRYFLGRCTGGVWGLERCEYQSFNEGRFGESGTHKLEIILSDSLVVIFKLRRSSWEDVKLQLCRQQRI